MNPIAEFITSQEMTVGIIFTILGITIGLLSIVIASFFNTTIENRLQLANIFATSIVGSAALAIVAIEFTKKTK